VLVLTWLLAATATVTVGPGAATDCPSSEQLARALGNVAPGIVAPNAATPPPAGSPPSLRLMVATGPELDVRVDLVDPQGETVLLHRVLPAPPRGRAPDCAALADTIALIVDRYLRDVGYEAPPLPPPAKPAPEPPPAPPAPPTEVATVEAPPPPQSSPEPGAVWRLGVAVSGRVGDSGGADGDGALALAVESTRLGARLSAGVAPEAEARWTAGGASQSAALRRLPFRMGGYVRIPAGPGRLEPGLGLGADLLLVSGGSSGTASGRHAAPFGDAALGYTMPLMGPVYGRALGRIALSVPYDFNTLGGQRVWGTPRVFGEVGVELGLFFQ
jgi:hypothetical protein